MPILSQFYTKRPWRMCNFLFQHGFDPPLNVRKITILVLLNIPYSNVTSTTTNKNNAGWRNTRTLRCQSWGEASLCRLRTLIAFENNRVFKMLSRSRRGLIITFENNRVRWDINKLVCRIRAVISTSLWQNHAYKTSADSIIMTTTIWPMRLISETVLCPLRLLYKI